MKREINVLSLFDGMSCGQIALERAAIKVKNYYASEINKHTIKVTQSNYPSTIQLGDITKWREWDLDWSSIDLIMGGSPCQGFSIAGGMLNFDDPRSKLFFEFSRILEKVREMNSKVKFLLENVFMIPQYEQIITEHMGVNPEKINSALVSGQRRRRYYWANWEFDQPEDKGIIFEDIIDYGNTDKTLYLNQEEIERAKHKHSAKTWKSGKRMGNMKFPNSTDKKSQCLSSVEIKGARETNHIKDTLGIRVLTRNEYEKLQTVPVGYTDSVSDKKAKMMLGNGWTVDVISHILKSL